MTLDLTQFHDAFFEESFEALDAMEAALLKLDLGAPDAELINTIFRVAHSIKGGSATFGFTEIASFTHSLETLLDELRANRLQVTQQISDLLLKSVDAHARHAARRAGQAAHRCAARGRSAVRRRDDSRAEECRRRARTALPAVGQPVTAPSQSLR